MKRGRSPTIGSSIDPTDQAVPGTPKKHDPAEDSDGSSWDVPHLEVVSATNLRQVAKRATDEPAPSLAPEIVGSIAKCLESVQDLGSLAQVARSWRTAVEGEECDSLWRYLWIRRYGPWATDGYEPPATPPSNMDAGQSHPAEERPPNGWRAEHRAMWCLRRGSPITTHFKGHSGDVGSVRICCDRQVLFSAAPTQGEARLWDIRSGEELARFTLKSVYVVGETQDKLLILVSNAQPFSRFFSLDPRNRVLRELFAVDSSFLATGAGCLRLLAVIHRNRIVLARRRSNEVFVFDLTSGACCAKLRGHNSAVEALSATNEGQIVTFSVSGEVIWWDINTFQRLRQLQSRYRVWEGRLAATTLGHLVAWDRRNVLWVLDALTGSPLRRVDCSLTSHVGNVGMESTVDGAHAILMFYPNPVIVSVLSGRIIHELQISAPSCVTTSRDSKLLITGSGYGFLQIWRIADGKMLRNIETGSKVRSVRCAGDTIAAGLESGHIVLFKYFIE